MYANLISTHPLGRCLGPKYHPLKPYNLQLPENPRAAFIYVPKNDRARFYVQLEEWRSLCTAGGDVGVTDRWQHAMFQGLGKRGGRRGEERGGSPEKVACRRRSHGSVSENEKEKG